MWISIKDTNQLPEEGKYVIAKHSRGTWIDSTDQENVNTVVVKLVKGISIAEREFMKTQELSKEESERVLTYRGEDEFGNNRKPYKWEQFGPDSFFGQDITHWMSIPE